MTLTIRQAQPNFPKRLRATPDALEACLYPRGEHDLGLHQGVNFRLVVSPGGKKTVTVDSLPGGGG